MPNQIDRNIKVLSRLLNTALMEKDKGWHEIVGDSLEDMLNDLFENDFFGTEGQSDPRGDFRNGDWSMKDVEGF